MCVECVKVKCPDRGSVCLETGSYLVNFQGCASCHSRENIQIQNRHTDTDDEEGEERVTYDHVCAVCEHLIAEHQYEFRIEGEYQEYSMVCILCGRAEDTVSILPIDPNKQLNLF
ncbi:protein Churchill-like isoform X2 [Acanthaster planci]|uniref:Protein Churchill n=1 Tax=Acanthaster planci TaxID=133434 RepID=A0A8B7YLM9_ACAPL|nr:protein Churchill-like isoform X2 [Acanthaster planci]